MVSKISGLKNQWSQKPVVSKTSGLKNQWSQKPVASKTSGLKNLVHQCWPKICYWSFSADKRLCYWSISADQDFATGPSVLIKTLLLVLQCWQRLCCWSISADKDFAAGPSVLTKTLLLVHQSQKYISQILLMHIYFNATHKHASNVKQA